MALNVFIAACFHLVIGNVLGERERRERKTLAFTLSLPVSPREVDGGLARLVRDASRGRAIEPGRAGDRCRVLSREGCPGHHPPPALPAYLADGPRDRLTLSKETLRNLEGQELAKAIGGTIQARASCEATDCFYNPGYITHEC